MSGAGAVFVVGLISGVISIVEATKTVYDAAKDAKGQPEAFRRVAAQLPLVIDILHSAEERAWALDETAQDALELILELCQAKAENLMKLFQKVIRKDDDKWYDRYKKALSALGKGDKVECLMGGILKDIQVLVCEQLIGTATEAQVKEIEEAIKQMNEIPSSLPDEAIVVQMPLVPYREDIDATWNYLRAGIEWIMQSPENTSRDMHRVMGMYTAVHNYCSAQEKAGAYRGAHLPEENLYQCLARFLTSYIEDLVKSRSDAGEIVLAFYIREWDRYIAGAKFTNHIFRYLNRHWIKRELEKGKKNVFDVYTLHLVKWREVAFAKLHGDVMEAVLKMVERQRNGETIEHGLIKSMVDSFVAVGLDEAGPTKSTLHIYRHYFQKPFLHATKKFYQNESKQFVAENGVVEYMKKAEARLKEEDERVKMYLHPDIAVPLTKICNTALIADHETLLQGEFQSLLDNNQVDDMARMYKLFSRIPGGLDFLPTMKDMPSPGGVIEPSQVPDPLVGEAYPSKEKLHIEMLSSTIEWQGMEAILDFGSDESWISKEYVQSLCLPINTGRNLTFVGFGGSEFASSETVSATWAVPGESETFETEFRVLPIGITASHIIFGKFLILSTGLRFHREMTHSILVRKRETQVEREEDMPREIEEDESSVGSMPTDKSTASGFSRPIDHTSSLFSGYTSIESRTDIRIDHNELTSRDKQFLEDVEKEEEDGISQKSVGSFGDVASSKGESLIDSDIQKFAQSLILEVLEEDEVLKPLVRESLSKFKRDRVINNLTGFINGYCVLLSGSQPTLNQKKTIRHFRRRSRQFAGLVCENLDPSRLELQGKNSEDKSRAQIAERNARLARFLSGSSPDALPPWSEANYDGNEYDHESWSDSEGLPPVLEDIKIFLTNGEALKLFRQHFTRFVAGEPIKEWNSMIEYRLQLQKGMDEKKALPKAFYFHQPKNTHDVIELDNGQGFEVSWRCRCSRRFQARIPGSERQAAEEFCQRMDWNGKRDGLMVTHCFNLRWLEDLLWALAPNMLSRFSFESSGNGAEAGDLEAGNSPDPVEPVPNSPDRGSQGIGTQTVRRLISENAENHMIYICFFRRTSSEWRLKHAKINRNSNIDSSEMREAVLGVDSQNMDKALFLALRERIVGSWKGISWFNPMIIKGLEFWEFKLYHTAKLVRPVKRNKLPYETKYDETESPDANAVLALEEWEYTHLTGQRLSVYKEFLDSEYLLHLLKFPEDAHSTSPVWTGLPRKIRTKLINRQPTPKIGWGFSIQHEWNSIAFTVAVCPIILAGFIMATYLSIKYEWPASTGIALATGVVTLVTFVNTMLGAITKQNGISQ